MSFPKFGMSNQIITIMTLHNNDLTALTEETLVLVDLATINCLPLPALCGISKM